MTTNKLFPASPDETSERAPSLKVTDVRQLRPVALSDNKSGMTVIIQPSEFLKVQGRELAFATPNNASLFMRIAARELRLAELLYARLIAAKSVKDKPNLEFNGRNLRRLYDYLEHIQTAVISIYTAIESLANISIPSKHKLRKRTSRGIMEVWDKAAIERWCTTVDKIGEIAPKALGIKSPKTQPFWQKFKALEEVRNDIIHQKISDHRKGSIDSAFLGRLLSNDIFQTTRAGFDLIAYFCEQDTTHQFFPLGLDSARVKPEEVDDISKVLTPIKKSSTRRRSAA